MSSGYCSAPTDASPVEFVDVGPANVDVVSDSSVFLISRNKSSECFDLGQLPQGPLRAMLRRFGYGIRHNRGVVDLGPDVWRAKLGSSGPARRLSVSECGWRLNVAPAASGSGVRVVNTWFCGDRVCLVCAVRRSNRLLARYGRVVEGSAADSPLFSGTLTVPGNSELKPAVSLLFSGIQKFLAGRRRLVSHPLARAIGGVVSVEVKRGEGGLWHPHAHVLIASSALSFGEARNEWVRCAPGSRWAWFGRVEGPAFSACLETFKYSLKRELTAPVDVLEMVRQTKGMRFLRSFGSFYGLGRAELEKVATVCSFVWDGSEFRADAGAVPFECFKSWSSGRGNELGEVGDDRLL